MPAKYTVRPLKYTLTESTKIATPCVGDQNGLFLTHPCSSDIYDLKNDRDFRLLEGMALCNHPASLPISIDSR
jgi:hypothetical protein